MTLISEFDQLVNLCRAGDKIAYDQIVSHFHGRIYRLAYRMLLTIRGKGSHKPVLWARAE